MLDIRIHSTYIYLSSFFSESEILSLVGAFFSNLTPFDSESLPNILFHATSFDRSPKGPALFKPPKRLFAPNSRPVAEKRLLLPNIFPARVSYLFGSIRKLKRFSISDNVELFFENK